MVPREEFSLPHVRCWLSRESDGLLGTRLFINAVLLYPDNDGLADPARLAEVKKNWAAMNNVCHRRNPTYPQMTSFFQ